MSSSAALLSTFVGLFTPGEVSMAWRAMAARTFMSSVARSTAGAYQYMSLKNTVPDLIISSIERRVPA